MYCIKYKIDGEVVLTCHWQSEKSAEVVLRWLYLQGHKVEILSIRREEDCGTTI